MEILGYLAIGYVVIAIIILAVFIPYMIKNAYELPQNIDIFEM